MKTRNPALYYRARPFFSRAELAEAKKRAKTYKERKKHDRFDGMPEEEVSKRVLPDHLTSNLDIIIVSPRRYTLLIIIDSASAYHKYQHS